MRQLIIKIATPTGLTWLACAACWGIYIEQILNQGAGAHLAIFTAIGTSVAAILMTLAMARTAGDATALYLATKNGQKK